MALALQWLKKASQQAKSLLTGLRMSLIHKQGIKQKEHGVYFF